MPPSRGIFYALFRSFLDIQSQKKPKGKPNMGKPVKLPSGKWWVQFKTAGVRESGTFATRREADDWQARRKLELRAMTTGRGGEYKTLGDAMRKFRDEVSPTHKGERWETIRINHMLRHPDIPHMLPLSKLTPAHIIKWRDARLREVSSPNSVLREMGLFGSILGYAKKDWRWIESNPMSDVRRPKPRKHRDRVISWSEIRIMLRQLGYHPGKPPMTMTAQTGYVFLIALRTGMRDSEITGLVWGRVKIKKAVLPDTKNGWGRDVPLSRKTERLIGKLRSIDEARVFMMAPGTRDTLFRRARNEAGLRGFTFHDARHTAATWIGSTVGQPGRLSFPEFVKVFGWRDPKNALIYVNPTAESLADKL